MGAQRETPKCSLACHYCRVKKAKCSMLICYQDHDEECWYPTVQQRAKKRKERDQAMDDRFARLEAMLQANMAAQTPPIHPLLVPSGSDPSRPFEVPSTQPATSHYSDSVFDPNTITVSHHLSPAPHQASGASFAFDRASPSLEASSLAAPSAPRPMVPPPASSHPSIPHGVRDCTTGSLRVPGCESNIPRPQSSSKIPPNSVVSLSDRAQHPTTAIQPQDPYSPPHTVLVSDSSVAADHETPERPVSYLSICSGRAVDWISREVGVTGFINTARRMTEDVMRNEGVQRSLQSQETTPEPDAATAWKWISTFFDEGLDSVFGVVHRPAFEARLRAHFERGASANENPAWYALRNTIYAAGCRITLSEPTTPAAFTQARTKAWSYFQNALSVHTDLIYSQGSDITAVQALLSMAFFAEALGTPALEFMLVSNATRLAQSKGLHLQVSERWRMTEDESLIRYWLWWCVYAYDKHLAYRSGRPTAIDDDDISSPIPTTALRGSTVHVEFSLSSIRHAQISSAITRRLYTVKASRRSLEETLVTIQDLQQQLDAWRQSLPPAFRSKPPFRNVKLPPKTHLFHVIYLHFVYYGSLIAINSVFAYPWNKPDCESAENGTIVGQRERSTEVVADAARNIIMATQKLDFNAASPVWLTFYFPLIGLINLFIYVLKHPHHPSAYSDISLMDVVVGHFGYLEYTHGSELDFPFPREIVSYARMVVTGARDGSRLDRGTLARPTKFTGVLEPMEALPDFSLSDFPTMGTTDFGLEDWPSFLPSFSGMTSFFNGQLGPPEAGLFSG